jgi:hypothetical protein
MMSWKKLLHYLAFLRRAEEVEISSDDLLTMDTHMEEEMIVDEEGLMVENGEVVGETAIITAEKQLQPTGGPLPERYVQVICVSMNSKPIVASIKSTHLIPTTRFCFEPVTASHTLWSSFEDQSFMVRPCSLTTSTC